MLYKTNFCKTLIIIYLEYLNLLKKKLDIKADIKNEVKNPKNSLKSKTKLTNAK